MDITLIVLPKMFKTPSWDDLINETLFNNDDYEVTSVSFDFLCEKTVDKNLMQIAATETGNISQDLTLISDSNEDNF